MYEPPAANYVPIATKRNKLIFNEMRPGISVTIDVVHTARRGKEQLFKHGPLLRTIGSSNPQSGITMALGVGDSIWFG